MKIKLTQREKILLSGLGVVLVIFIGFRYFVEPTLTQNTELHYKFDKLVIIEAQVQNDIIEKDEISGYLINSQDTLNEKLKLFAKFNYNEDIDKIITPIIKNSGLNPKSLNISLIPTEESKIISKNRIEVVSTGTNESLLNFVDTLNKISYVAIREITSDFDEENMHQIVFDYFISLEENLGD